MEKLAIIFDCGATNVRVVAMNSFGEIKASHSLPNSSREDPFFKGGRIWDLDEIWGKLCTASREVMALINPASIVAVTTTTFGVDGTWLGEKGNLLYPVISWQCERTIPVLKNMDKYISPAELYNISGTYPYSFNTINKLIWLKEAHPEILDKAAHFLFMPSLLNYLLCGEKLNDLTMLGTSMLTDIKSRRLSPEILNRIGVDERLFGDYGKPGQRVGQVHAEASVLTGIPEGTLVCLGGHDTQFAIFGSGAGIDQPVLSSGTWEILMVRSDKYSTSQHQFEKGITTELDAVDGIYDIGLNWIGSGIIEWIKHRFYAECSPETCYETMMNEAAGIAPGSNGVFINPDFNSIQNALIKGNIGGLTLNTSRAEITRAAFEALSYQLKMALTALEQAGNFKAQQVICVGGGSKNSFWNQLRADVLGIPVVTIDQKETTVLGASFFAFTAAGVYPDPESGKQNIPYNQVTTFPSSEVALYTKLYQKWQTTIQLQTKAD
ncbi:MAG: L-fuculokinase [Bacteroidales bacterium]|nr:L-fuculokinase [Bacteroidales bacterium]